VSPISAESLAFSCFRSLQGGTKPRRANDNTPNGVGIRPLAQACFVNGPGAMVVAEQLVKVLAQRPGSSYIAHPRGLGWPCAGRYS
jgi:hypothetical protein